MAPVCSANAVVPVESQKIPEDFVPATVQTALEAQLDTLKQQVLSRNRLWGLVEEYDLYREERRRLTQKEVFQLMRRDIWLYATPILHASDAATAPLHRLVLQID